MSSGSPPNEEKEENQSKKKKNSDILRGEGSDAKRVSERIKNFDYEHSEAAQAIQKRFPGITHPELLTIAEILADDLRIKIDRDAKRDNRVLIKWFDEQWDLLRERLQFVNLLDANHNPITPEMMTQSQKNPETNETDAKSKEALNSNNNKEN